MVKTLTKLLLVIGLAAVGITSAEGTDYCAFQVNVTNPSGEPFAGVNVLMVYKGTTFAQTQTDAKGTARLCDAPLFGVDIVVGEDFCGSVLVRQIKPPWLETRQLYVTYVKDSCGHFAFPPDCRVLLRVRDSGGRPIAEARFEGTPSPSGKYTDVSDEFGRLFRYTKEPGKLEGLVTKAGYVPAMVSRLCGPGPDHDDGELDVILRKDR